MEILANGGEAMKNKVLKIIKENGFLLFLFICVCIVAIGTISIVTNEMDKGSVDNDLVILDDPLDAEETGIIEGDGDSRVDLERDETLLDEDHATAEEVYEEAEKPDEELDIAEEVFSEGEDQEDTEEIEFIDDYVEETVTSKTESIWPVQGKVITEFTKDKLIYSETLDEWRGHSGIDINADLGEKVVVVLDGTVTKVFEDTLWGKTIVVDHGNGLESKYCNLGTLEMVKEGLELRQGDNIATVGKSAQIESAMEPHLHFELINNQKSVDPRSIIP